MTPSRPPRRFIAGAVCPECRAVDRLVLEEAEGERRRVCVSCGFRDTMEKESGVQPPTRFTRHGGRPRGGGPDGDAPTPVRIVDPDEPSR